ncbi:hypothetical protein, partial [Achromobacter insuavis]
MTLSRVAAARLFSLEGLLALRMVFHCKRASVATHLLLKACQHRDSLAIEDMPAPRRIATKAHLHPNPLPLNACPHQDCLWSARATRHAQPAFRRAD